MTIELEQLLKRTVPAKNAGIARLPNDETAVWQNYQDGGQIVAILSKNGNIRATSLQFPPGGRDNPNPPPFPGGENRPEPPPLPGNST